MLQDVTLRKWKNHLTTFVVTLRFNDMKNKYDEPKATLSNDATEKFKEILKEEISKINDKREGKIHQLCQDKSFLQEQISELKKVE